MKIQELGGLDMAAGCHFNNRRGNRKYKLEMKVQGREGKDCS